VFSLGKSNVELAPSTFAEAMIVSNQLSQDLTGLETSIFMKDSNIGNWVVTGFQQPKTRFPIAFSTVSFLQC